jgi:hypothetical protein
LITFEAETDKQAQHAVSTDPLPAGWTPSGALAQAGVDPRGHHPAGPPQVWPWLVQMGYGRGGFYAPEWIDRYFWRIGGHNANQLLPECQQVTVGDIIADAPAMPAYWQDKGVEPRALVYWSRRHPWARPAARPRPPPGTGPP